MWRRGKTVYKSDWYCHFTKQSSCSLQSGGLIFLWYSDGQIPQNYTPVTSLFPTCYFSCLLIPERVCWHHQISNRGSVLKSSLDSILLLKSLQIQTHTDISYNPLPVFLISESLWMKASDKWTHVNEKHFTLLMIFTRCTWQYTLSIKI